MTNRRKFLNQAFWGGIGIAGLSSFTLLEFLKNDLTQLTILHTNDMHSHIDPFPANDPKYPGLGGMVRRAAMISKIKQEGNHVLLLDAGDVFQGTPYFNLFGGEPEFKLMSEMGYEACTIGNHEFDNGLDGLAKALPHAQFPFICSNYNFSNTPMHKKTIPYKVFKKGNLKIGVFGLGVELEGLVDRTLYGETIYEDPLNKATKYTTLLRNELNCDVVICLSHLGYKYSGKGISDEVLARQTKDIDLIIGGHTHTFLNGAVTYKNSIGKNVLVNQAGWAGIRLGRVDFFMSREKGRKKMSEFTSSVNKNCAKFSS
jgi:5'-nucleotidase